MELTGAGVECQTPVPEVPVSILSRVAVRCSLRKSQFHSSWGNDQKLIDSVHSKQIDTVFNRNDVIIKATLRCISCDVFWCHDFEICDTGLVKAACTQYVLNFY